MITAKFSTITFFIYILTAIPGLTADNQGGDLHDNRRVKNAITSQEARAYRIKGDLIFRIHFENTSAKLGEEFYLNMELINVSDRPQDVLPLDLKFTKTSLEITDPNGGKIEYIGPLPRVWIPWLVRDMVSLEPAEGLQVSLNLTEFYGFKKAGSYRVIGDYNWEKWNFEGTGFALESRQHILSNSMSFTLSGNRLNLQIIAVLSIALVIVLGGLVVILRLRTTKKQNF